MCRPLAFDNRGKQMFAKKIMLAAAGVSLMALAACGEDETATSQAQPTPPTQTEPANPDLDQTLDDAEEAAGDALSRMREAAEEAASEAGRLAGEARTRAEQALEDAGPTLDRAGEVAGQIGASVGEIVERARGDLERAARELEARINQSTTEDAQPETGDPDAELAPAEELRADTRAAARALSAGVGPDYVGVWAAEASSCARIDREAVEMFAVITPTTMRRHESVCNIDAAPLANGSSTFNASCIAEGMEEDRQITFTMPDQNRLSISYDATADSAELIRCHLPE